MGNTAATGPANTPTVTGADRTWTQVATIENSAGNTLQFTLFRSLSGSANSGALTIDLAGQTNNRCTWSLTEYTNVATTGTNGADAVVQSATGEVPSGSPATSLTVTLAAFGNADNATYGTIITEANVVTITEGSGFTEIAEASPGESRTIQTEFKATNDTSVDWTFDSSVGEAIAVEIKFAVAGAPWNLPLMGVGN